MLCSSIVDYSQDFIGTSVYRVPPLPPLIKPFWPPPPYPTMTWIKRLIYNTNNNGTAVITRDDPRKSISARTAIAWPQKTNAPHGEWIGDIFLKKPDVHRVCRYVVAEWAWTTRNFVTSDVTISFWFMFIFMIKFYDFFISIYVYKIKTIYSKSLYNIWICKIRRKWDF